MARILCDKVSERETAVFKFLRDTKLYSFKFSIVLHKIYYTPIIVNIL